MLSRFTQALALIAMLSHLWVSTIGPWHYLSEHRLAGLQIDGDTKSPLPSKCGCKHHRHTGCHPVPVATDERPEPASPPAEHDCQVCQLLAQAVAPVLQPAAEVTPEQIEFAQPVSTVRCATGFVIRPLSRGPPVV